jgi:hypothetical protein
MRPYARGIVYKHVFQALIADCYCKGFELLLVVVKALL